MQTITHTTALRAWRRSEAPANGPVVLVQTMGALHAGHLALIKQAKALAAQAGEGSEGTGPGKVVVSVFINPKEFGPSEDFSHYPRSLEADCALCSEAGVDAVFAPSVAELYPEDELSAHAAHIVEGKLTAALCGASRPHYFPGVCTLAVKLCNLVQPTHAVLGQKDAQLCAVMQQMVQQLNMPVSLHTVPTVREADGLALSTRNARLSPAQREEALKLSKALNIAKNMVGAQGITQVDRIEAELVHQLTGGRRLRIIYASVVHAQTLQPLRAVVPGQTLIALACWVDEIRLIDNVVV